MEKVVTILLLSLAVFYMYAIAVALGAEKQFYFFTGAVVLEFIVIELYYKKRRK